MGKKMKNTINGQNCGDRNQCFRSMSFQTNKITKYLQLKICCKFVKSERTSQEFKFGRLVGYKI